jgi:siderophore synthetase component
VTITDTLTLETFDPKRWARVSRCMLAKSLSELSYEQVFSPRRRGESAGSVEYELDLGAAAYRFRGRPRMWQSIQIDETSIERASDGSAFQPATDPLQLFIDAQDRLGMAPHTLAHLLRELSATLVADAHIDAAEAPAHAMAGMSDVELESRMTGHPWIVFNKGRVGFGYDDYLRYAPEVRRPIRLPWIAVHREVASFHAVPGLTQESLLASELGEDVTPRFADRLAASGGDLSSYHLFPVHPFQLDNIVVPLFATELASGRMVLLGESEDEYQPLQSVRTMANLSRPDRHYVKLPLHILNTMVWRGLLNDLAANAPRVTEFVTGLQQRDPFLADECRVVLLGEVASCVMPHGYFDQIPGAPYQYRELLGAIWRESIEGKLDPGERSMCFAALLHVDGSGRSLLASLVDRSGLEAIEWIRRLMHSVLPTLLHFLYRYGLVFSPHGQNAVLVLRDDAPTRLCIRDYVDDVNLTDLPLPELAQRPRELERVLLHEPADWLCQFVQCALFIGHFRYLSRVADDHLGVPERTFWRMVRDEVEQYHARFPEQRDRYRTFELLGPDIERLCLNRQRLFLDGYTDSPTRPHVGVHGRVANALYEVRQ